MHSADFFASNRDTLTASADTVPLDHDASGNCGDYSEMSGWESAWIDIGGEG